MSSRAGNSRSRGGSNNRTFYNSNNVNHNNYNVEDEDDLPPDHYNGEVILGELLARFQFESVLDFDNYQKQIYMRFFNYIKDRPLELLMVAEKVAMAQELARTLSNHKFIKRRFYKDLGLDPSPYDLQNYQSDEKLPFLDVFQFDYNFYGFKAHVWMVATSGHVYSHDFDKPVREPEQAFFYDIVDVSKNLQKSMPLLLENIAKESDAVIVWSDNDLEGESIGFEVVNTVKKVLKTPPGGSVMDVIYRAKFSSAEEANDAMKKLKRLDFRKLLAMTAQHILDLIWGKSCTCHQKKTLRKHFPNLNIDDLPFGPCQMAALVLAVDEYKIKENHIPKFTLEASIDNGKVIATMDSEGFIDRAAAEELCQKLKASESCEVIVGPISVPQFIDPFPGLNTFELLMHMSRYHGLSSSDVAYIAQRLYDLGLITYPRTETTKYPERARELILEVRRTLCHLVSSSFGVSGINSNLALNIEAAMSKGMDKGDHPPIIPTSRCPSKPLSSNEALVYSFICCRFMASFLPKYEYFKETTVFGIEDTEFEFTCFKPGKNGFTKVLPQLKVQIIKEETPFVLGDKHLCDIQVKEIPPPKLLPEYEMIKKMQENNVGTDGTIPTHISTLQKTGYVEVDETTREITPTPLGINLMDSYKACIGEAVDPAYRAKFIQDINGVASGERGFIEVFDRNLKEIWKNYKKFAANFDPTKIDLDKFESCFQNIADNPIVKKNNSESREPRMRRQ